MSVVITGATGRIGQATMALLRQTGAPLHVLTRHLARATDLFGEYAEIHEWHPLSSPPPAAAFKNAEVVINLMGEPVAGRWSRAKRKRVVASRVTGTEKIVGAIENRHVRLVNASSYGIYPGIKGENYDEATAIQAPTNAVQSMIQEWERTAMSARTTGHSVATIRYGMISGITAYPQRLVNACRKGIGTQMGDGSQIVPLIDINDAARLTLWAATVPEVEGPINAVAPSSMTLGEVMEKIVTATGAAPRLKLPDWAARRWLGPSAPYHLGSFSIRPMAAMTGGFQFSLLDANDIIEHALSQQT